MKDEELKELAKDLYSGRIFTDRHLDEHIDIQSVFMALMFLESETKAGKDFFDSKPALIYEYLDQAGPMSINGYPMFFSFRYLNQVECDKMFSYYEKIKEAMNGI